MKHHDDAWEGPGGLNEIILLTCFAIDNITRLCIVVIIILRNMTVIIVFFHHVHIAQ